MQPIHSVRTLRSQKDMSTIIPVPIPNKLQKFHGPPNLKSPQERQTFPLDKKKIHTQFQKCHGPLIFNFPGTSSPATRQKSHAALCKFQAEHQPKFYQVHQARPGQANNGQPLEICTIPLPNRVVPSDRDTLYALYVRSRRRREKKSGTFY